MPDTDTESAELFTIRARTVGLLDALFTTPALRWSGAVTERRFPQAPFLLLGRLRNQ